MDQWLDLMRPHPSIKLPHPMDTPSMSGLPSRKAHARLAAKPTPPLQQSKHPTSNPNTPPATQTPLQQRKPSSSNPNTPPATQTPVWQISKSKVCACDCRQQLVMMGSPCWGAFPAKLAACWMSWQMCWGPLRASQLHKRVSTSTLCSSPYSSLYSSHYSCL